MLNFGLTQPVLAQVNFGGTWSSFLGIALAGSGIALYALRSFRPKLARDHDIFFAAVALLCGGILFFQGWRQDPILQFGQFLLTASAIFFAVESVRLRGIATEQAKRNTPIVDDERPVSRVYRAELDELNPYEERPAARRIRGSRDARDDYRDEQEAASARSRRSRRPTDDRYGAPDAAPEPPTRSSRTSSSRRRRPRPPAVDADYTDVPDAGYGDVPSAARRRGSTPPPPGAPPDSAARSRRPRPPEDIRTSSRRSARSTSSDPSSEYVDYRPVEDEEDSWGDY